MSSISPCCNICKETFESRNKLFIHIKDCHSTVIINNSNNNNNINNNNKKTKYIHPINNNNNNNNNIKIAVEDDWFRVIIKPQGVSVFLLLLL
jgi:23S rRNA-/tRNA-specific pseudouridylate synthase